MEAVLEQVDVNEIKRVFDLQQQNRKYIAKTTVGERKEKLRKLLKAVESHRDEIRDVLHKDLGRGVAEADLTEIFIVTSEIKHYLKNLKYWMRDKKVSTGMAYLGSSGRIKYEAKGVCLIIAPWNFPVHLTLTPLISAIAAGNTAIVKPSEFTPNTTALLAKIIRDLFPENEVAVFEGAVETSTELLKLPFNHIFFTGSPAVGKIVMRAAADNLASVTLELGGKSPTIVDETADVKVAARRILWGKNTNAGQQCIAPDYVYVHESKLEEFVEASKKQLDTFFEADAINSSDFGSIVNERNFNRLVGYIEEAVEKGANVVYGGKSDAERRRIEPTLLKDVPMESALMQEEIFGPILPIKTFKNIEEVIDVINSKEKPLAFYIYSKNKRNIRHILDSTSSGGVGINHHGLYYNVHDLPFGGVNNSGIGKSHGHHGFMSFTNERAIYQQHLPAGADLLMPPHAGWKQKIIDVMMKMF